jgi:hypothetical protein
MPTSKRGMRLAAQARHRHLAAQKRGMGVWRETGRFALASINPALGLTVYC